MSQVATTGWTPTWENFIVLRANARWTGDPGEDSWEVSISLMDFAEDTKRLMAVGYMDVIDGSYRVSAVVGMLSHVVDPNVFPILDQDVVREIFLRTGNDILHDRSMAVVMGAGALVGANVRRSWQASEPRWRG